MILISYACKSLRTSTLNMSKQISKHSITKDIKLSKLNYGEIFEYGKSIIPTLIDSIESDSLVIFSMRVNPAISDLRPYINQYGVRSAYAIELILAKDSIEPISDTIFVDLEAKHITKREIIKHPYCIFNYGIIKKVDADFNIPLTHHDMIKIQKMYRNWWEDNKKSHWINCEKNTEMGILS